MNARSYSPLSFKEKAAIFIALFSLVTWQMPGPRTALAKTADQDKSQILKIEISSDVSLSDLQKQNLQKIEFAKIDEKVSYVRNYLLAKNSPLADYTEYLVAADNWKTLIAISNAESGMGKHCYYNNCWGVGGITNLAAYKSMPDAIQNVQTLIDQRYGGMTLKQMNCKYVQPCSSNWLEASSQVYNDLSAIEQTFIQESS
jgi:hypothetical protein